MAGRRPHNSLTPLKVKSIKAPGRHADGGGLYLEVDPPSGNKPGPKRWVLRLVAQGRRRDMGLGSVELVTLAEARDEAIRWRRVARDGGDPIAERRKQRAVTDTPTFAAAARQVHREHAPSWRNDVHARQWIQTLETYAFPVFGDRRVDLVDSADVLRCLSPIWLDKAETARRTRKRIGTVLDWAKAKGFRTGANAIDDVRAGLGLPKQKAARGNHAAMPYDDVPGFIRELREADAGEATRLALEFLIVCASRTGEVIYAKPGEIDLKAKVWTVPADRMKSGREHRVPLPPRAVEIAERALQLSNGSGYLFPGRHDGDPLSNMAMLMLLRRLGRKYTAHGFRAAFATWRADRTSFSRELAEAALAHVVEDRTERSYQRGELLERRRALMLAWAGFCTGQGGKVVRIPVGVA